MPCILFAVAGTAQALPQLLDRLRLPAERSRATVECRRLGPAAAQALVDALSRPDCREPEVLAEVLGELGAATRGEVPRLTSMLPGRAEPQRTLLLRAIANGVTACDAEAIETLRAQLGAWAAAGFFYSEKAEQPTFAWYEYVRLQRRLSLRLGGMTPDGLMRALDYIRNKRTALVELIGDKREVYDLGSFGQHATREELEAIAELALAHGADARGVVAELARYLRPEKPRPGEVLKESCAGHGENAPVDLPAVKLPTLWRRDDWRFAIARAVLAIPADRDDRLHAIRHLLHAPAVADRFAAFDAVRTWPKPWREFTPDLAACLDATDRNVVREALILFGLGEDRPPADQLERLMAGGDDELAVRARRLSRR